VSRTRLYPLCFRNSCGHSHWLGSNDGDNSLEKLINFAVIAEGQNRRGTSHCTVTRMPDKSEFR
jgi:hypothetical protein